MDVQKQYCPNKGKHTQFGMLKMVADKERGQKGTAVKNLRNQFVFIEKLQPGDNKRAQCSKGRSGSFRAGDTDLPMVKYANTEQGNACWLHFNLELNRATNPSCDKKEPHTQCCKKG